MFWKIVSSYISNIRNLSFIREERILLGRWNNKNRDKYFEWGSMDNCYNSMTYSSKNEK